MIKIKIDKVERSLDETSNSWICQQIERRQATGWCVCVCVSISVPGCQMRLRTPGCEAVGGGGRAPNSLERHIFELWEKHGLDSQTYKSLDIARFLAELKSLIQ